MFCGEPKGVMEQEHAFIEALALTKHYRVESPGLSLLTAQGTFTVIFARAN